MKTLVYSLIVLLAIVHQDFWWWDDSETLVLGFMPIGLAYHAGVSVAAGVLWALAVHYCWPEAMDVPRAAGLKPARTHGSGGTHDDRGIAQAEVRGSE